MRQSESIAQLAADLAKARGELTNPVLDKTNPHFKNNYVSLNSLCDHTASVLSKHGLSIVQVTQATAEGGFYLITRLLHKSGEWLEGSFPIPVDRSQVMGSAITYARRYSLAAMCGIAGEPDDDGEATRTNGNGAEQPDLGSIKGDGPSRHASRKPYEVFLEQLAGKTDLDDLNQWWVETRPTRDKQMNSETRHFAFMEMMKQGLAVAPGIDDLRLFWVSHKAELEELKRRNASEYHGLEDHKEKAKGRFLLNAG